MINLNLRVVYFYYGIEEKYGNKKGKYYVCFHHAVKLADKKYVIETEIKHDDSYYFCEKCQDE